MYHICLTICSVYKSIDIEARSHKSLILSYTQLNNRAINFVYNSNIHFYFPDAQLSDEP